MSEYIFVVYFVKKCLHYNNYSDTMNSVVGLYIPNTFKEVLSWQSVQSVKRAFISVML